MQVDTGALLASALGFSVALAWNKAISKSVGDFIGPKGRSTAIATALIMTVLVILVVEGTHHLWPQRWRHSIADAYTVSDQRDAPHKSGLYVPPIGHDAPIVKMHWP